MSPNQLAELHAHVVERAARRVARTRDPGAVEELVGVGNAALVEAAHRFNPRTTSAEAGDYLYREVKLAMLRAVGAETRHRRRLRGGSLDAPLDRADAEGATRAALVVDTRACEPADELAARERLLPAKRGYTSLRLSEAEIVAPPGLGPWAARLRAAAFDSVTEGDMADIMKKVVERAKKGNLAATKLLLDYVAGGRRSEVRQTVVVQHRESQP